jgi:hypothetical protein
MESYTNFAISQQSKLDLTDDLGLADDFYFIPSSQQAHWPQGDDLLNPLNSDNLQDLNTVSTDTYETVLNPACEII